MEIRVSAIIVSFNSGALLPESVQSALAPSVPAEAPMTHGMPVMRGTFERGGSVS